MKKMRIYVIVDKVSQNLLRVFQAVSIDEAKRSFQMYVNQACKEIPDKSSIQLCDMSVVDLEFNFQFSVPECYSDVFGGSVNDGTVICDGVTISDSIES